jgi:hypothetical protein
MDPPRANPACHLRPDENPDSRAINLNRSAKSPRTAKGL